ncbi:MAG: fluoride efflux transporter CrcB [Bacteroidetes bacterium HGW-Bacteroidetes-19]|nr:MAG: fluoride efflux transporter CrcB [Bacteroidetes bacterium HGW-Bacteroidetes-20]PKP28228.1 MAG: fluoride efflux transporter CrcB [Bacteroidetes bacterium HGW-Bacteroidetes-19]
MKEFLLVFIGSGFGGASRFFFGRWINSFSFITFPYSTMLINVLACFVLGLVVGLADHRQIITIQSRLFWMVGFCGGFSTFSAFSFESLTLIQQGSNWTNILYVALSLILCLAATYIGVLIVK